VRKSKFYDQLAIAVAGGQTIKSASETVGCALATAYHVSADPDFRAEVAKLKTQAVESAVAVLTSNATAASNALVRLLASDDEKIVLAAAAKILATLGPLQELAELRQRLDQLENQTRIRVAQ
jgi:hypothetical protein